MRPRKAAEDKQEKDIRVKMTEAQKADFIAWAAEDGMDEVSVWLKWLAKRRIRELRKELGEVDPKGPPGEENHNP